MCGGATEWTCMVEGNSILRSIKVKLGIHPLQGIPVITEGRLTSHLPTSGLQGEKFSLRNPPFPSFFRSTQVFNPRPALGMGL